MALERPFRLLFVAIIEIIVSFLWILIPILGNRVTELKSLMDSSAVVHSPLISKYDAIIDPVRPFPALQWTTVTQFWLFMSVIILQRCFMVGTL
jgi:hypothetical protein